MINTARFDATTTGSSVWPPEQIALKFKWKPLFGRKPQKRIDVRMRLRCRASVSRQMLVGLVTNSKQETIPKAPGLNGIAVVGIRGLTS